MAQNTISYRYQQKRFDLYKWFCKNGLRTTLHDPPYYELYSAKSYVCDASETFLLAMSKNRLSTFSRQQIENIVSSSIRWYYDISFNRTYDARF
eukprot:scaffold803_cov154-Chaetoceros_neogracile.AAC.3